MKKLDRPCPDCGVSNPFMYPCHQQGCPHQHPVTEERYTGFAPCPCCDGAGEWDEGPLPASSGATEPDYRQVICPECEGAGKVECDEPRTLADLEDEACELDALLEQMAKEHSEGRVGDVSILPSPTIQNEAA